MSELITFLHLSDIHFSKRDRSSPYELDEGLRREIEHDARAVSRRLGGTTGILVSGDIAFSGQPSEYANVKSWLAELSKALRVPSENIWIVPGNHDINRIVHEDDEVAAALRYKLRTVPLEKLDQEIESLLRNEETAKRLFAPLNNYLQFAGEYDCPSTPERLAWSARVDLGPYAILLRGVNTVLVSDDTDDRDNAPLVVGKNQTQLNRELGVVHLTIAHHPRTWIRDGGVSFQHFDNRAVLQLTGHDHRYETSVRGNSLCIAAGAAHPSRKEEGWEPRYNFVVLELVEEHPASVRVRVYPRVLDPDTHKFDGNLDAPETHNYALDDVTVIEPPNEDAEERPLNHPADQYSHPLPDQKAEVIANKGRRLAYRLALLRSGDRRSVAVGIGVPLSAMAGRRPDEIVEVIMEFARDKQTLHELWNAVETAHGVGPATPNPYALEGGETGG